MDAGRLIRLVENEGSQFKPQCDLNMEGVLVEEVSGHLKSTVKVPLSKVLNHQMLTQNPEMNPSKSDSFGDVPCLG